MGGKNTTTIAVLGSHSALDICAGAKKHGFKTLIIAQKGREKTYAEYYKTNKKTGCVDECLVLGKFKRLLNQNIQKELNKREAIFIPHRSFEVYLNDYDAIENEFNVPIFGNRYLLKIEERGVKPNQYDLLREANIRIPKIFKNPRDIDRLCLVKALEKERGFERSFFLAASFGEYKAKADAAKQKLSKAVIEEFIIGVQVNFNFFYSPINKRLELLGTDTRRQTNFEGLIHIPAPYQKEILEKINIQYEEAGHAAVTVLESMLEKAFEIGERFVKASQKLYPPGIIGPFALQSFITPGPPKKDIVVVDVSPRVPGSPGISATPYGVYLYGKPISVGERIALEIKNAIKQKNLETLLT